MDGDRPKQIVFDSSEIAESTTGDPRSEAAEAGFHGNRGVPLNLDWVDEVRENRSAIERRAQTLVLRRTVKKEWQAAWLLRAIPALT